MKILLLREVKCNTLYKVKKKKTFLTSLRNALAVSGKHLNIDWSDHHSKPITILLEIDHHTCLWFCR